MKKIIILLTFFISLSSFAGDKMLLAKGQWYFEKKCAFCHKAQGQGDVGPNLTDDYYIYGNTKEVISSLVRKGIPAKGMPVWENLMPKDQIDAIVAYVYSIRGTNIKGKAPEGALMKLKPEKKP